MSVRYLFNTAGDYVAFAQAGHVFSPGVEWLGFLKNGNEYYARDGRFVGYVLDDDRVARKRGELPRPRITPPLKPLRPLKPLKPLKRLRKLKLPHPYEDVFEHGVAGLAPTPFGFLSPGFDQIAGTVLVAADNQYLGNINKNHFDVNSLSNQFGPYGNPYSPQSVFNEFAQYGNPFSPLSPLNEFSRTPPRIEKDGKVLAYLTTNQFVSPRIDPNAFFAWIKT